MTLLHALNPRFFPRPTSSSGAGTSISLLSVSVLIHLPHLASSFSSSDRGPARPVSNIPPPPPPPCTSGASHQGSLSHLLRHQALRIPLIPLPPTATQAFLPPSCTCGHVRRGFVSTCAGCGNGCREPASWKLITALTNVEPLTSRRAGEELFRLGSGGQQGNFKCLLLAPTVSPLCTCVLAGGSLWWSWSDTTLLLAFSLSELGFMSSSSSEFKLCRNWQVFSLKSLK